VLRLTEIDLSLCAVQDSEKEGAPLPILPVGEASLRDSQIDWLKDGKLLLTVFRPSSVA
jgi:hypothetical protein